MQPKFYKSVIDDVIEGVRDVFAEEGADEQVLKELKRVSGMAMPPLPNRPYLLHSGFQLRSWYNKVAEMCHQ